MTKITIFKNHNTPNNPTHLEIEEVFKVIRSDKYKPQITKVFKGDKEAKSELPCIVFGGEFGYRSKESLIEASGYAVLDFDYTKDMTDPVSAAKELKEILKRDNYIHAVMMSPSYKGVKALVKIPKVESDEEYKSYYYGLLSLYPYADTSTVDISRICYVTHDPDLYVNENSTLWDITADYNQDTPTNITDVPLKMMKNAQKGEKHDTLRRASVLLGGYVPTYISEQEAVEVLSDAVRTFENYDQKHLAHFSTIKSGVKEGMKNPLTIDSAVENKLNLTGNSIIETEKLIVSSNYGWDILGDFYDGKIKPALITGIPFFDKHYPSRPNELRTLTGAKGRGKTSITLGLAVLFHVVGNIKYIIACLENPVERAKESLFQYLSGVSAMRMRRDNPELFLKYTKYIDNNFIFINVYTIEQVLNVSEYLINKEPNRDWEIIIDPVNKLMAGYGYHGAVDYKSGMEIARKLTDFSLNVCSIHLNTHLIMSSQREKGSTKYSSGSESSWFISAASMTATIDRTQGTSDNVINVDNIRDRHKGGCETDIENPLIIKWDEGYNLSFRMLEALNNKDSQNFAIDFVKKKFNWSL